MEEMRGVSWYWAPPPDPACEPLGSTRPGAAASAATARTRTPGLLHLRFLEEEILDGTVCGLSFGSRRG